MNELKRSDLVWCLLGVSFLLFSVASCSSQEFENFDQKPFPEEKADKTVENGFQIRLSESGLNFMEKQVPSLIKEFLPNGLDLCVPETESSNIKACVESECDNGKAGCQLNLKHKNTELNPKPASDALEVILAIENINEKVPIDYDSFLGTISCEVDLHKKNNDEDVPAELSGRVPIEFSIDKSTPTNDLEIDVGEARIDLTDLGFTINNRGGVGDAVACGAAGISKGVFRGIIEEQVHSTLNDAIQKAAKARLCRSCNEQGCPDGSSCKPLDEENESDDATKICQQNDLDKCVSRTLGAEGQLLVSEVMQGFSQKSDIRSDVMAKASDHVDVNTGLDFGSRTAMAPEQISGCVPSPRDKRPSYDPIEPSSKILANNVPGTDTPFMIGVGLHKRALNHALWGLWASGGMCMEVDSSDIELLSTNTVGTILNSLQRLTDENASVKVQLAPQKPPELDIKEGSSTSEDDNLVMELNLKDLDIHLYAFIGGRYVRFLTVRTELVLPFGIAPKGENEMQPVFGNLENGIKQIAPQRAGLLEKSPSDIKDILPSIINIALPRITDALEQSVQVPTFLGYKLDLQGSDIRGIDETYLGVFANFEQASNETQILFASPTPTFKDISVDIQGEDRHRPDVRLNLKHSFNAPVSRDTEIEYRYRVDGGFWSTYRSVEQNRLPPSLFALPGKHKIEVQSRVAGYPATTSKVVSEVVRIDYNPPNLRLERKDSLVTFDAEDTVDKPYELEYRYRVASTDAFGEWSAWETKTTVDLEKLDVEPPFEMQVEVKDKSQRTTRKTLEVRPNKDAVASTRGCSTGSNSPLPFSLLALLVAVFGGRRLFHRNWLIGLMGLMLVIGSGCSDGGSSGNNNGEQCTGAECDDGKGNDTTETPECGEDEYLCKTSNTCKAKPTDPCASRTCDNGQDAVPVRGGEVDNEECTVSEYVCRCPQTPRQSKLGWYGGHSDVVVDDSGTFISIYNKTFGDLMVGPYTGERKIDWTWVDGLPSGASSDFEADKPRGGLEEKGPSVGQYTAITRDGKGNLHVLYRDADNKALKYARGKPSSGDYNFSTRRLIDKGDTGYFSDIWAKDGNVYGITSTYRVKTNKNKPWRTRVEFFSFSTDKELSSLSISKEILYSTTTANPCGGGCESNQACFVKEGECFEVEGDCDSCQGKTACRNGSCRPVFGRKPISYKQMAGVDATLVHGGSSMGVVFYDQTKNHIVTIKRDSDGWGKPTTLTSQTGPFASAIMDSDGKLHLAYMDHKNRELIYREGLTGDDELITSGTRTDPTHLQTDIGESVTLKLDDSGSPVVIYQDTVSHALKRATRQDSGWTTETLAAPKAPHDYAHGFYATMNQYPADRDIVVELMINNLSNPPTTNPNVLELQ
jgi:hypothetical protein